MVRVAGAEAAFSTPAAAFDPASDLWETYECPAGSLVLFTEATSHSGQPWTNAARDRCAVFHAYNALNTRWTLSRPSDAQARRNKLGYPPPCLLLRVERARRGQLEAMSPLRASLFRESTTKENRTDYALAEANAVARM